jgi:hypothetical protein
MSIPIGKIFNLAMKILPHIGTAVSAVQILKGDAPGPEKKEAALELVKIGVQQSEDAFEHDLLDDAEVSAAAGEMIDVAVKFAKIVNEARERRVVG